MDESPFPFDPVPLRSRRDGWTPERQRDFIALVAKGLKPGRAAARVGMRRQGAYELRMRAGGEGFAAAWDAAAAQASRRRIAGRGQDGLYARAVTGILRPIRHRRRIVAMERRFDDAALIRLLGILDRSRRNPVNGESELFSPMDREFLSAFAPETTLYLPSGSADRPAIGGGGIAGHPLQDVAPSALPET